MKKTWTLYSNKRGRYQSSKPGQFAAIITEKIAGRLDCYSGKQASPKNRIFLRYLEDMPEGYRFCKICQPEILRVGDRLDYLEARARALGFAPHVSLWALGILKDEYHYEPCRWYAALNWGQVLAGRELYAQHTLSDTFRYHKALSAAIQEGKRLGIPVVRHGVVDSVIRWLPARAPTEEQKKLVKTLQIGDGVITLAGSGAFDIK